MKIKVVDNPPVDPREFDLPEGFNEGHIEDVVESINILIKKKFNKIVNISSGKKINLIEVCKAINAEFHKKKNSLWE